ncbi:lengsin-like [Haliotis rufescens]|uniref:lengsin-like n=1 Tax=Haliotis rufescens TaxID=6454 RepID=UPI001EB088A9|nr:lengsin-like [Haliotis rufescens]
MDKIEQARVAVANYDYIRFAVCDINGTSRGPAMHRRYAEKYLLGGLDLYEEILLFGYNNEIVILPHDKEYHNGNATLVPDLDTLRPIPWAGENTFKVAEILCESRWKKDLSPQAACPRYVARQQLKQLDDLGFQLYSGFEIEYFLFDANTLTPVFPGKSFLCQQTLNKCGKYVYKFDNQLKQSGIDVEKMHLEYAPGMFEAALEPKYGIEGVDAAFNLKQGLLELADQNDLKASFMSKLDADLSGAGCHYSLSILAKDTGENAFYDVSSTDNLSPMAKQWIAGILKHSKALAALTSPTINCYRRLHQPWAPGGIYWNIEDRATSLRVKNHGPSGTYLENRMPSGRSNPYLVMAATIAAGLDGVRNKLVCPPPGNLKDADLLPKSLPEALKDLKDDSYMVSALGQEMISWFLKCKEVDIEQFKYIEDDKERFSYERKVYF